MHILVAVLLALALAGCGEAESVTVVTTNDTSAVVNGKHNQVSVTPRVELDPRATQIRVWMCPGGQFTLDSEDCDCYRNPAHANSPCDFTELKHARKRETIQDLVKEKYPRFTIARMERTQENYVHWRMNPRPLTVYYLSLETK